MLTSPNHIKKTSRIRVVKNIDFEVDLGSLLEAFLDQKSYQKSGEKKSEEKIGKSGSKGVWGVWWEPEGRLFLAKLPAVGVGGVQPINQKSIY